VKFLIDNQLPKALEHPASQRPTESPFEFSSNIEKQKAEF